MEKMNWKRKLNPLVRRLIPTSYVIIIHAKMRWRVLAGSRNVGLWTDVSLIMNLKNPLNIIMKSPLNAAHTLGCPIRTKSWNTTLAFPLQLTYDLLCSQKKSQFSFDDLGVGNRFRKIKTKEILAKWTKGQFSPKGQLCS